MKKNSLQILLAMFMLAVGFGCDSNSGETPEPQGQFERGVLVINEGNFGSNDGEVFHYDPENEEVTADIFEKTNNRPFAGLIQNMVEAEGRLYLVANTGKVEIVDAADFSSKGAISSGLDITQSAAVANGKLYVSDWGPYDENWGNPNSYVAVVNSLDGGAVAAKIPVSSRPEGMVVLGNKLLVANAAAGRYTIIDSETDQVETEVEVQGSPSSFFERGGNLYLFARDAENIYLHEVNKNNFTVNGTQTIALPGNTSNYALGANQDMYVLTSTGWPDYTVARVNYSTGQVFSSSIYAGSGFYGIGYHEGRSEVYVADNNAFQGNGTVIVLNAAGEELRKLEVGRAPSGFLFR
jgi:YVTN family beta-propeller protein